MQHNAGPQPTEEEIKAEFEAQEEALAGAIRGLGRRNHDRRAWAALARSIANLARSQRPGDPFWYAIHELQTALRAHMLAHEVERHER